jgi:membrane-associated phospholipid phosphatase
MYFGTKQKNCKVVKFLKENSLVFLLYGITLWYSLNLVLTYDKVSLHYSMNQIVGHPIVDSFFVYLTWLGDGNVAVMLIAILLVVNVRKGLETLICFALAGLVTFLIKRYGYDEVNRPSFVFYFFVPDKKLKLIEGVSMYIHNSYPSGHATQAFAIGGLLLFLARHQWQKLLLLTFALLTAYSRVYLSQHWLVDVIAGSIVGISMALLIYAISKQIKGLEKLNKPIWQINR